MSDELFAGLTPSELELLKARAARYAKATAEAAHDMLESVIFTRGSGRYGVVLSVLREIRPLQSVCLLPGASPVVPGVLYYRAELLSVHDLSAFMNPGARAAMKPAPWVLIVEHEGERLGLLADAVVEIRSILTADVRPLPITLGDRSSCFKGVLEDGLLLLHAPPLFSNPHFFNAF
ncbi:MAG: chemotaxis protein CheW [Polyangia bacterium]